MEGTEMAADVAVRRTSSCEMPAISVGVADGVRAVEVLWVGAVAVEDGVGVEASGRIEASASVQAVTRTHQTTTGSKHERMNLYIRLTCHSMRSEPRRASRSDYTTAN